MKQEEEEAMKKEQGAPEIARKNQVFKVNGIGRTQECECVVIAQNCVS
jgi:hypothetical protein